MHMRKQLPVPVGVPGRTGRVSAFPHDGEPISPARGADRVFWMAVRQSLTIFIAAIEARYLPDLKKNCRRGDTT